jgi:hypothetical protein
MISGTCMGDEGFNDYYIYIYIVTYVKHAWDCKSGTYFHN